MRFNKCWHQLQSWSSYWCPIISHKLAQLASKYLIVPAINRIKETKKQIHFLASCTYRQWKLKICSIFSVSRRLVVASSIANECVSGAASIAEFQMSLKSKIDSQATEICSVLLEMSIVKSKNLNRCICRFKWRDSKPCTWRPVRCPYSFPNENWISLNRQNSTGAL